MKPLIIDFTGVSCTGKTHIKNKVFEHLSYDRKCLDFSDYEIPLHDYFIFIFTAPKSFVASLYLIFFHIPRDFKHMFTLLKKWLIVQIKIKKAQNLNYDYILFDEGFFKWFAVIRRLSLRKLFFENIPDSVKKNFYYPDLTISVEADFDSVQERKITRGLIPEKGSKALAKFTEYQRKVKKDLLSAEKMEFTRVIYYNNSRNFDVSLLKDIQSFLTARTENH